MSVDVRPLVGTALKNYAYVCVTFPEVTCYINEENIS